MEAVLIALGLLLTLGLSYWNARVCGQVWVEANALGGWIRAVVWSGAVQSAIGFSALLLLLLGVIMSALGVLPASMMSGMASLWYLLVIIPVLLTGWVITVHSWISLARDRSLINLAATGWNTYASISNTYGAVQGVGSAWGNVKEMIPDVDSEDIQGAAWIAILAAVIVSLVGGAVITWAIIKAHRGTLDLPQPAPNVA